MLVTAITSTIPQLFSPPFRQVLWKSLGMTIALLIGVWFGLEFLISTFLLPVLGPWPWMTTALSILLGGGLLVVMGFLIAPVMSIFAGLFLDDIAEVVERTHYPNDPPGSEVPVMRSVGLSLRFFVLVVAANIAALLLVVFFGLGVVIFFVVNGYLLGREYFQFAALRHGTEAEADALRERHTGTIFLAGLVIAALLAVPIVNLLTPLFAGALMVHVHKALAKRPV